MKRLKEIVKTYIAKVFSDVHSAIVGVIVSATLLGILGSIYFFAKNLWTMLIQAMQTPTPLWASIALVLLLATYTYLKTSKSQSSSKPPVYEPNYITKYFPIKQYTWETKIYEREDNYFEVDETPLCTEHDLKFILGKGYKYCDGPETEICTNRLLDSDHHQIYESAKSIIDNKVRNNNY